MKDHLKGQEDQCIIQQMVIETLYELTKGEAYITTGAWPAQMWAAQWYNTIPRQFVSSPGLGSWVTAFPPRSVSGRAPDKQVIELTATARSS
jgi:acetolactate synthase-1/2/3 large subunit